MHGLAIAAQPLARDGLGLLTADFGRTRLAEILDVRREPRAIETRGDAAARATRP